MNRSRDLDSGYDLIGLMLFVALIAGGWAMIFASEYLPESYTHLLDFSKNYGKQLLFIGLCVLLFGVIQLLDAKIFESFAIFVYIPALILLIGVLFTKPINGSTSWYDLGFMRLQPSELAKWATSLMVSSFMSRSEFNSSDLKQLAQALGLIGLPMAMVLMQGDLGSTLVFTSFAVLMFRVGVAWWIYVLGLFGVGISIFSLMVDNINLVFLFLLLCGNFMLIIISRLNSLLMLPYLLGLVFSYYFYQEWAGLIWGLHLLVTAGLLLHVVRNYWAQSWQWLLLIAGLGLGFVLYSSSVSYLVNNVLQKHQQERIWVWLRPEKCDPLGALYNVEQSKYAIGSGHLLGKGYLQGERTKLDYVPEQSTDFIFCTVGEEWGVAGSFAVLGLFLGLLIRIVIIAERQRDNFTRYYAYCVAGILFFHLFINIGMTIGLVPVVGIPLPFISYGGSSLMAFCLQLSILFKLDSQRHF